MNLLQEIGYHVATVNDDVMNGESYGQHCWNSSGITEDISRGTGPSGSFWQLFKRR